MAEADSSGNSGYAYARATEGSTGSSSGGVAGTGEAARRERDASHRTAQQNRALHKWLAMVCDALNDAGYDMKSTLKPEIEISWTPEMAKEYLWRPIQKIMTGKESTADANTRDYDAIRHTITRHIGEKLGVELPPWPDKFHTGEWD